MNDCWVSFMTETSNLHHESIISFVAHNNAEDWCLGLYYYFFFA